MLFKGQALSKEINNKEWEKHQKERDFLRRKRAFLWGGCCEYQREEASVSLAHTARGAADLQSRQNSAPCWGQKLICFLRNASELRPPLSKSNNPAFIGEEERREDDCRLKLVRNSCLNMAPRTCKPPNHSWVKQSCQDPPSQGSSAAQQRFHANRWQKPKNQLFLTLWLDA